MTDYRVTVTVKNARILKAMEKAGFKTIVELSRASGLHLSSIYDLLGMKKAPMGRGVGVRKESGKPLKWTMTAQTLAATLKTPVEKLFSETQRDPSGMITKKSVDVTEADIKGYISSQSYDAPQIESDIERVDLLKKLILQAKLTPLENTLLVRRFFNDETLEEIAKDHSVCKERIRQRINKAMRKIGSPAGIRMFENGTSK